MSEKDRAREEPEETGERVPRRRRAEAGGRPPRARLTGGDLPQGGTPPASGHAGRARLPLIMVALLLVGQVIAALALAPTSAYADADDAMGFRTVAGTSMPAFYEAQDGAISYCSNQDQIGPGGSSTGNYTTYDAGWSWCTDGRAAIIANGYPYTTTINGTELTEDEAHAATQIAIYMYLGLTAADGSYDYYGYDGTHHTGSYANYNSSEVIAAARFLYEGAIDDTLTAPNNAVRVYTGVYSAAGNKRQDMLYAEPDYEPEPVTGMATLTKLCATDGTADVDAGCSGSLAGAEYDVVAMEDVVGSDGAVQASAGEVVDHVITGEDGTATTCELPLGTGSATYAFVETVAPEGHVLDTTPVKFTLTSEEGTASVVQTSVTAYDVPNEVIIDKTILGTDAPLAGATFKVWLDGDEDSAQTATTDEGGQIVIRHLSAGTYHIQETAAPDGYVVDDEVHSFTVTEDGLVEGVASLGIEVEDDYTKVHLSKRDITDESEVVGATLTILDADGEVIDTWVSTEDEHVIEALATGTYTLVEEMTPHTYDETTAVEFEVLATGEVQSVAMYDEPIRIEGEIDKRQEIADPTAPYTEADGDGLNVAETSISDDGSYDYSLDFRSTSTTWVDEFTVTDTLEAASAGLAHLTGITTAQASEDYDGMLNVWYQTNLTSSDYQDESSANATLSDGHENPWLTHESCAENLGDDGRATNYDGWRLWAQDVSATSATYLCVDDLGLEEGEYVTAIRFEYGRVEEGFTTRVDGWDREDLKSEHDDVDDVTGANDGTFALEDGTEASYAPAVIHMQVTDDYVEGADLTNSAEVDLYRNGGNVYEGEELEDHDEDCVTQTPQEVLPQIDTMLTDAFDGDQVVTAGEVELIDTVAYEGAEVGVEHIMTLTLMSRATGEALTDEEGNVVTASVTFVPEEENGTVDVPVSLDTSELAGSKLVAYETMAITLADAKTGESVAVTVATHEDPDDEGQTVRVATTTTTTGTPLDQTGSGALLIALSAGIVAAAIGGAWLLRRRAERRRGIRFNRYTWR